MANPMTQNAFNNINNKSYQYQYQDIRYIGEKLIQTSSIQDNSTRNIKLIPPLGVGTDEGGVQIDVYRALEDFKNDLNNGTKLVGVFNTGGNHWIAYALYMHDGTIKCIYKNSLGDICSDLENAIATKFYGAQIFNINSNQEQILEFEPLVDGIHIHVNCGIFALKNMLILAQTDVSDFIQKTNNVSFFTPGADEDNYVNTIMISREEFGKIFLQYKIEELQNTQIRRLVSGHHEPEAEELKKLIDIPSCTVEIATIPSNPKMYQYKIKLSDDNNLQDIVNRLDILGIHYKYGESDNIILCDPNILCNHVDLESLQKLINDNKSYVPEDKLDYIKLYHDLVSEFNILSIDGKNLTKEILNNQYGFKLNDSIFFIDSLVTEDIDENLLETTSDENILDDITILKKILSLTEKMILGLSLDSEGLLNNLHQIGRLFNDIKRADKDANIIRNKHGYRNPYDGNNKNIVGAMLDFEALSYLSNISTNESDILRKLLISRPILLKDSLIVLKNKIEFILCKEDLQSSTNDQSLVSLDFENSDLGFLRNVILYNSDVFCIKKVLLDLDYINEGWYKSLDLQQKIDRYALGYFIVQLGESTKTLSDFLRPESNNDEHYNFTRTLFSKLLSFRNTIKEKPAILHNVQNTKLYIMKSILEEINVPLKSLLNKMKLELYSNDLNDFDAIIEYINTRYTEFHRFHSNNKFSDFELENLELIESITSMLKVVNSTTQKEITTVKDNMTDIRIRIEREKLILEKLEECSNNSLETPKHKLQTAVFTSNIAKKIINLSKLSESKLMQEEGFSQEMIDIVKVLANHSTISSTKQPNKKGVKDLGKELKSYLENVQKKLEAVNDSEEQVTCDHVNDGVTMNNLLNWIKSDSYRPDAVNTRYVQKKINDINDSIKLSTALINSKQKCLTKLESFAVTYQVVDNSTTTTSNNLSKFESLVIQIVKEIEFLQFLHITIAGQNPSYLSCRLYLAAKMSVGFLGQSYKLFKENHSDKTDQIFIKHSILSDDCMKIITIRHKQLMHNIVHSNQGNDYLSEVVKKQILPWCKDFKYIPILFRPTENIPEQLASGLIPDDSRLIANFDTFSDTDKVIFWRYTKIVALNRFLQSDKAIEEYNELIKVLPSTCNPELLTEIYWQGATSYRNLGDFHNVSKILAEALKAAERITCDNIKNFKICGLLCDIGVTHIQIDEFDKAERALQKVSKNLKAAPHQIIGANVMIGETKIAQGKIELGISYLELTFVKYCDLILEYNPIILFSVLEQLANHYLDEFHLEWARDCLEFLNKIYEENYPKFVAEEGQHLIYYQALFKNDISRYNILKALLQPSKESDSALEKIYSTLIEAKNFRDILPFFDDKEYMNAVFLRTVVLAQKEEHINLIKYPNKSNIKTICQNIIQIKQEIIRFLSNEMLIDEAKPIDRIKHEKFLQNLTRKMIISFENNAFKYFGNKNFTTAKIFMKKAVLYQGIVDFLEFEVEEIMDEAMENIRQRKCRPNEEKQVEVYLDELFKESMPKFVVWTRNPNVNEQSLVEYLRQKLFDHQFTQEYFIRADSIVKCYEHSKNSKDSLKKLINIYENNLCGKLADEHGGFVVQMKVNKDSTLSMQNYMKQDDGSYLIYGDVGNNDKPYNPKMSSNSDIVSQSTLADKILNAFKTQWFNTRKLGCDFTNLCQDISVEINVSVDELRKIDITNYCIKELLIQENAIDIDNSDNCFSLSLDKSAINILISKLNHQNLELGIQNSFDSNIITNSDIVENNTAAAININDEKMDLMGEN